MKQTINYLKARFETGDKPNGQDFADVFDTLDQSSDITALAGTVYTKTETDSRIQAVVGAAPAALDTLKEIADRLASDESAASALTNTVAAKADASSVYTKAEITALGFATSSSLSNYATTAALGNYLPKAGGTMSGPVDFGLNTIKQYCDVVYGGGTTTGTTVLSLANGGMQKFTLGGAHQFTLPTATSGASFTLILIGGANYTPTFSGVTNWIGTASKATAPTLAVASGNINILTFFAEGGAWYGFLSGTGV